MKIGTCPRCLRNVRLTKHHWTPKSAFGHNDNVIYLCRQCHNKADAMIRHTNLNADQYKGILKDFLSGILPFVR